MRDFTFDSKTLTFVLSSERDASDVLKLLVSGPAKQSRADEKSAIGSKNKLHHAPVEASLEDLEELKRLFTHLKNHDSVPSGEIAEILGLTEPRAIGRKTPKFRKLLQSREFAFDDVFVIFKTRDGNRWGQGDSYDDAFTEFVGETSNDSSGVSENGTGETLGQQSTLTPNSPGGMGRG